MLQQINAEITKEIAEPAVQRALLATTFKNLDVQQMKQAIMEGMMRGFVFKDFLEKNIYAIPFSGGYSLVTSVDYARKIGMRSGIVGKSKPDFEVDDKGKIISCTITVKKNVGGIIGEFAATVYFDEYYKAGRSGRPSLWDTKPRTMIAKVAEMHALRMACPEELSQAYVEEELHKEVKDVTIVDTDSFKDKLTSAKTLKELGTVWSAIPIEAKQALESFKNELKAKFAGKKDENK